MNKIMLLWHRIPEQIRRLLIPFFIIIVGYFLTRWILVPSDFGLLGHYRASSITTNMQKEIRYAGAEACTECHDQIVATKKQGYHRGVSCEACHGPTVAHIQDPGESQAGRYTDANALSVVPRISPYKANRISPGHFRFSQPDETMHFLPPAS